MTTCVLFAIWFLSSAQWQAVYVRDDGLVVTRPLTFSDALMLEPMIERVVACPLKHEVGCS